MSIFDKQTAQEPQEYKFITSDINDFINDFSRPKQEMPDAVDFNNFPATEEQATFTDDAPTEAQPRVTAQVARSTARMIVATIDTFIPEIMRYVAKADNAEEFKADGEVRGELEAAFTDYIKIKGVGDIPPGMMIVILLLTAYGSKIPMLMQLRKANIKAEEDKAEIEALKAELSDIKKQRYNGTESSKTDNNNRD